MRKLAAVLMAAVLVVMSLPAASASGPGDGRLFAGYVEGVVSFDFGNPKACEAGFTTITTTSGIAMRTGRTDMDSSHCVVPYGPLDENGLPVENLATVHSADMVLTAANGDEIWATYEVIIDPFMSEALGDDIVAAGTVTFDGGTGRFEEASGEAYIRNVITFEGFEDPEWAARAFWVGRIDY